MEDRALCRLGLNPNPPALLLEDSFADSQTDSRTLVLLPAVQSLENDKYPVKIPGIDPDAIVRDGEYPFPPRGGGDRSRNMDLRGAIAAILDRIADQILKNLHHLRFDPNDAWQRIVGDCGLTVPNGEGQVIGRFLQGRFGGKFS